MCRRAPAVANKWLKKAVAEGLPSSGSAKIRISFLLYQMLSQLIKSQINRSKVRPTDKMLNEHIKYLINRSKVRSTTEQKLDQKINKQINKSNVR